MSLSKQNLQAWLVCTSCRCDRSSAASGDFQSNAARSEKSALKCPCCLARWALVTIVNFVDSYRSTAHTQQVLPNSIHFCCATSLHHMMHPNWTGCVITQCHVVKAESLVFKLVCLMLACCPSLSLIRLLAVMLAVMPTLIMFLSKSNAWGKMHTAQNTGMRVSVVQLSCK